MTRIYRQNHRMPGRALRPEQFSLFAWRLQQLSESPNARKGIKTFYVQLCPVRRARQNHRMPGRALRQNQARERGVRAYASESSNARKGIKTELHPDVALRGMIASESSNARKGIKTKEKAFCHRAIFCQNHRMRGRALRHLSSVRLPDLWSVRIIECPEGH